MKLKTNANIYDYILHLCVSNRSHQNLDKPFTRPDGMVYATNSFMAVRFPIAKTAITYNEGETKAEEVYPKSETIDAHLVTINTGDLLGLLSQYGLYLDLRRNCEACHGGGEKECFHCGHDSECDTCNGTKKTGEEKPLHTFSFSDHTMKLDKRSFTPTYLHVVALIAAVLGDESITLDIRATKAHVTYSDGSELLLMLQHNTD